MSQSEKLDATTVALACGAIRKALQQKVVLSKYSETVGLIYNISTGNPHEILKQILQSSLFGNILDFNFSLSKRKIQRMTNGTRSNKQQGKSATEKSNKKTYKTQQ